MRYNFVMQLRGDTGEVLAETDLRMPLDNMQIANTLRAAQTDEYVAVRGIVRHYQFRFAQMAQTTHLSQFLMEGIRRARAQLDQ